MKDEKIKEIMISIENRFRHAYNCGYHDGVEDTKKWLTSEVIAQLNALVGWVIPALGGPVWYAEIMGKAVRTATEAIERNQWIPCSERLPDDDDGEVLCCDANGEQLIGYPYVTNDSLNKTGFAAVNEDLLLVNCVAWMPLPEPHKGGE